MSTTSHGSVRMGPISIFTLIVVLCLAVMAVLSVTTSQATYVLAQRQAHATVALYANETAAQEFVAQLDETLSQARSQGQGGAQVRGVFEENLNEYCADAQRAGMNALMIAEQAQWKSLDAQRRAKEPWVHLDEQASTTGVAADASSSLGDQDARFAAEIYVNARLDAAQDAMAIAGIVGAELDIVDGVYATFETNDGRKLEIVVGIHNDATYEILAWKTSAQFIEEGDDETLWTGGLSD